MTKRSDCLALDAADPLAPMRSQFSLARADEHGVIYLDGNSLGALPAATAARVAAVVDDEWGVGLIRSWNTPRLGGPRSGQAGWIDLGQRIGDKIASLVGAGPSEVVVADSTSINLYKILSAAMVISVAQTRSPASARLQILSERTNFPTGACARVRARTGRR